jgi:putative membrane protein
MRRLVEFLILCAATVLASGGAWAAEPPTTADVLSMLHQTNEREVDMGRMAGEYAKTKDVRRFGKALVKDHLAAEKKVAKLAKEEKVELAETTAANDMDTLPSGDALDEAFAKRMLLEHQRTIAKVEAARDATSDEKLKHLLDELLPMLHRHEDTAQGLVNRAARS